jgi:hypothetical protein
MTRNHERSRAREGKRRPIPQAELVELLERQADELAAVIGLANRRPSGRIPL